MSATPIRIDFISDVVCPWCAVGLASLNTALARLEGQVQAEFHFHPFELNPDLGPEGESVAEHLEHKYGMTAEQFQQNSEALVQRAASVGFTIDPVRRERIYNTFDAHRLLHWAGMLGDQPQLALKLALLRAYHSEGRNISSTDVLLAVVEEAGLDTSVAAEILASDRHTGDVREHEKLFVQRGIRSVPAIILGGQHLLSGGQPPEVFENALRQLAAPK